MRSSRIKQEDNRQYVVNLNDIEGTDIKITIKLFEDTCIFKLFDNVQCSYNDKNLSFESTSDTILFERRLLLRDLARIIENDEDNIVFTKEELFIVSKTLKLIFEKFKLMSYLMVDYFYEVESLDNNFIVKAEIIPLGGMYKIIDSNLNKDIISKHDLDNYLNKNQTRFLLTKGNTIIKSENFDKTFKKIKGNINIFKSM